MSKVNLASEFVRISRHWAPEVVAELNGQQVKLAKLQAFVSPMIETLAVAGSASRVSTMSCVMATSTAP